MNSCADLSLMLSADASGALSDAERARLEAHLEGCADCRAERAALGETLALAALPATSELELHALHSLPGQVRSAWRAQERTQRRDVRVFGGGLAALAAALLVVLSTGVRGSGPARIVAHAPAAVATQVSHAESSLSVDTLADGPVELSDDAPDSLSDDPEVATTVDFEEGDE